MSCTPKARRLSTNCAQIGKTSSLVLTLTGILKSILLVVAGVLVWGSPIGSLQLIGYSLATVGLFFYSVPFEAIQDFVAQIRKGLVSVSTPAS